MDEQELAAIEKRLEWALSDLSNWDSYRQGNYLEGWGAEEILTLVAEVRRLRTMETRYRAHLARIRARWADADGTPLVGEWGLPWAMADDAQTVLEETPEQPCPACA